MWHGRIFIPTVFHTLVAWVEMHIALAPDWLRRALPLPRVLLLRMLVKVVWMLALLWQPLLTMVTSFLLKSANILLLPVLPMQVYSGYRLSPAAPEVVEVLRMVRVPSVALVLPVVRVSWVLLFVMHAVSLKWSNKYLTGHGSKVYGVVIRRFLLR